MGWIFLPNQKEADALLQVPFVPVLDHIPVVVWGWRNAATHSWNEDPTSQAWWRLTMKSWVPEAITELLDNLHLGFFDIPIS